MGGGFCALFSFKVTHFNNLKRKDFLEPSVYQSELLPCYFGWCTFSVPTEICNIS